MKKYIIITDSTTDLSAEYEKREDLVVLPLSFVIDDVSYKNFLDNRELSSEDFYRKIKLGKIGKTTQVNPDDFYHAFKKYHNEGVGILGIFFSSALSGTYNSARIAYNELIDEFPDANIKIVDSLCASLGEGLLVYKALKALNEGMSLEENYNYIENLKLKIAHWFTVSDMDILKRGGRVSASAAFFAKTLHINPVLHVSNEGKLVARTKKIGRKAAIHAIVDRLAETIDYDNNDVIFISHSYCEDDVNLLKKLISEKTNINKFYVNFIGPVIGSHTGIGTLSVFYVASER